MALFKIAKGSASNLSTSTISKKPIEGYCWFTTDDGRFYIDTSTSTNNAVIGTNRIAINGVHTASNSWTAGSSAGPTLSITINDITSTAAAIPSASKTASGIVTTGAQSFLGRKTFGYMNHDAYNDTGTASRYGCDTQVHNAAGNIVAEYWYDIGDATNVTSGRWGIRAYSPNSTADTTTTGKYETFYLPNVDTGRTDNAGYNIITTKNPADLGYYLPLTGGTLSGDITIAKTGEPALIVNNTSDHKAGFIIGSSSKYAGLWDYTNSKWIVYSTTAGAVTLNGNATTSSGLLYSAQKTTAADLNAFHTANQLSACLWNGWSDTDRASASYPGVTNGIILDGGYANTNFGFQIAIDDDPTGFMALRQKNGNGWQAWKRIPMGDGTGASGSWGISITGNAATATALSTSGTTAKFWRGDNTWSDTISGGTLKITANSNTTIIGSQNASFCHIYNSANIPFIFNNSVLTTGGNLGDSNYPFDNLTLGRSNGAGIYYKGTKATYRMIRFIDNTADTYGNGISIGGGGQTIIGGGESADLAAAQAGTAGEEIMQVCNDGDVQIISNLQDGWNYRKVLTLNTSGYLMCPSYINVPTGDNENPTVSQFIVTNGSDNFYRKASAAHAMAAIRSNASGTWGITSTNTYNLLNYSGNECTLGSSSSATNTDIWINYRSGYGGSTNDSAAQLSDYYFGNRKGDITGVVVHSDRFVGNSTGCSWIDGQRYANAAYNVGNATNAGSYWPWMRQTNTASAKWFSFGTINTSFYWMGSSTSRTENGNDYGMAFNVANGYLQGCSRVYGAVWNDYAEYRKDNSKENQEPGRCIRELGDGSLALTTQRLERGCEIVSDTFGFAIGQDEKNGYNTPIASNGRVLAYPYESIEEFASHIGWPVCSGPNGTVSIMTEEEEEKYPSRIIGTISEIPTYEEWGTGNVKVNGRVWIRIK